MKNAIVCAVVLLVLVFVSTGIPVFAETIEIPSEYTEHESSFRWKKSVSQGQDVYTVYYDYDISVYLPEGYGYVLDASQFNGYSHLYCLVYENGTGNESKAYKELVLSGLTFQNGLSKISGVTVGDNEIDVYVKINHAIQDEIKRSLQNDGDKGISTTRQLEDLKACDGVNVNVFYGQTNAAVFECDGYYVSTNTSNIIIECGRYGENRGGSYTKENSGYIDAIEEFENLRKSESGEIVNPVLDRAFYTPSDVLHIYYNYEAGARIPFDVETYDKLYVKISENEDWITIDNVLALDTTNKILSVTGDVAQRQASGHIRMSEITDKLGLEIATYEAVIWGVRYVYSGVNGKKLTQGDKSDWVFSRYVFEENVIDSPDVTIDDLGGLTNVTGGSSGVVVGGNQNEGSPVIGGGNYITEEVYNTILDDIVAGKNPFGSVKNLFSGMLESAQMVASWVGQILGTIFGNYMVVMVTFVLMVAVVLRLLGR